MGFGRSTRLLVGGLISLGLGAGGGYLLGPILSGEGSADHARKDSPPELRLERSERAFPLSGVVMAGDMPLDDAWVTAGDQKVYTDETGTFVFDNAPLGTITITRPGYEDAEYEYDGLVREISIPMEVRIIRAVHLSSTWTVDDAEYKRIVDLTKVTTVNSLVLDSSGDDGFIDYETKVQAAIDHDMITDHPYDVVERLQQAKDAGLYMIVRVSVFANPLAVKAFPQYSLGGGFLDPGKSGSWEYPLDLAVEACNLGFDEISFDYIRYPGNFFANTPRTMEGRVANIQAFLQEASDRLHPLGCAISASTLGGLTVVPDHPGEDPGDYGVGQHLEEFTIPIDVYAPMTYPKLWPVGSWGYDYPDNHPQEIVAAQLDGAAPRVAEGTAIRPWLTSQAYPDSWILGEISLVEGRGLGWMIWTDFHEPLRVGSFPAGTDGEG